MLIVFWQVPSLYYCCVINHVISKYFEWRNILRVNFANVTTNKDCATWSFHFLRKMRSNWNFKIEIGSNKIWKRQSHKSDKLWWLIWDLCLVYLAANTSCMVWSLSSKPDYHSYFLARFDLTKIPSKIVENKLNCI